MKHFYGPQIHIFSQVFLNSILAELCHPKTVQPRINALTQILYSHLLTEVIHNEFPTEHFKEPTRMTESHPNHFLEGERIKTKQKVVCVNLARAGTYPSHICYEQLHAVIEPSVIRQDHIFAARMTNEKSEVIGTHMSSHKIGGDIKDSIVLIPDPMGATGNTIISTMDYYKNHVEGPVRKMIALHLIVTPEYLKKVTKHHPDAIIYALRVDRGLSTEQILKSEPGKYWDQEKGLNEKDYIVPGAGGFGEIMNNSFV